MASARTRRPASRPATRRVPSAGAARASCGSRSPTPAARWSTCACRSPSESSHSTASRACPPSRSRASARRCAPGTAGRCSRSTTTATACGSSSNDRAAHRAGPLAAVPARAGRAGLPASVGQRGDLRGRRPVPLRRLVLARDLADRLGPCAGRRAHRDRRATRGAPRAVRRPRRPPALADADAHRAPGPRRGRRRDRGAGADRSRVDPPARAAGRGLRRGGRPVHAGAAGVPAADARGRAAAVGERDAPGHLPARLDRGTADRRRGDRRVHDGRGVRRRRDVVRPGGHRDRDDRPAGCGRPGGDGSTGEAPETAAAKAPAEAHEPFLAAIGGGIRYVLARSRAGGDDGASRWC